MLSQFRHRYPQGSLIAELVKMDRGKYIVRALVQVEGITLATGLGAADTVEEAEDRARERALALIDLTSAEMDRDAASTLRDRVASVESTQLSSDNLPTQKLPAAPPSTAVEREPSGNGIKPPNSSLTDTLEPLETLPQPKEAAREKPLPSHTSEPTITKSAIEESEVESTPTFDFNSSPDDLDLPVEEDSAPVETPPAPPTQAKASSDRSSKSPQPSPISSEPLDFSDIIAKSNVELKRLGWTSEQGREYLLQTYGKRSRQLLSDEELLEFLQYLESLPA